MCYVTYKRRAFAFINSERQQFLERQDFPIVALVVRATGVYGIGYFDREPLIPHLAYLCAE